MMTLADIPMPSQTLRFLADDAFCLAGAAVRTLRARFGAGSNAAPFDSVRRALVQLRRLGRLLRFALILLAAYLPERDVGLKPKAPQRRQPTPVRPHGSAQRIAFRPCHVHHWRLYDADAPKRLQPPQLAGLRPDPLRTVQRHLAALAAAVADPMPLVRRVARRMRDSIVLIRWRPPKRPPPTDRRDYWDELVSTWQQARFTLSEFRRQRCDSS